MSFTSKLHEKRLTHIKKQTNCIFIKKICAFDENNNQFEKDVELIVLNNLNNFTSYLLSFGWPSYSLEQFIKNKEFPFKSERFYIDARGRNHNFSPTYILMEEFNSLIITAMSIIKQLEHFSINSSGNIEIENCKRCQHSFLIFENDQIKTKCYCDLNK